MKILKTALLSISFFSAIAGAVGPPDSSVDLPALASNVLRVDGITDARIIEILEPSSPFIFTYCRPGSDSLWRHKVVSSEQPDERQAVARITYDQEVEPKSNSCKPAS